MILVSVHPYEPRKIFLLILGVICFAVFPCFAQPILMSVDSTPYDRQMTRIQPVLLTKAEGSKQNLSLAVINQWIQSLREIPYGFSPEWKTPREVESAPMADCKGKAVALYEKMQAHGARNVRLVIGKRMPTSPKSHAWLEWTTEGGTYVLDPTINWAAYRSDELASESYKPFYAYTGTRKYRAATGALVARN